MRNHIRSFLLSGLVLCSVLFAGQAAAAERELNFGIINTEASQNLKSVWQPFLQDMEKRLGLKVNAFFASDYAGIVTAMQYGKVDIAWYGNKSAMEAVDRANGEIFAQIVHASGAGGYYSHIITHKDSPLSSEKDMLADAKNLTFANGDPNSTSGFLVPGYYVFGKNSVDPKTAFKRTVNANHETNALSVAGRQVDVATCNSEALERLEKTHPDKRSLIKIIWISPLIPGDPLVWRKNLPENLRADLRAFFLSYGLQGPDAAREKEVLKALQWSRFRPSGNDQLIPIRQLELFKEKTGIEMNANMSAADRQARIAKIDGQLSVLNARQEELARKKAQ